MASKAAMTPAQKAARTRKRGQAALKAARTRDYRQRALKAWKTRRKNAAK